MTASLEQRFSDQLGQLLGPDFPSELGLAVSGGGDSMAMLALAHAWARRFGVSLHVVTVDHGLREASAQEAAMVARECEALGHPHTTLHWHWDGTGNLQDAARRARISLIEGWRGEIEHVLFAHTQNDVAETFLMRLARGSGVEGLSAMAAKRPSAPGGFTVLRPLLEVSRADLRHHIDTLKVPYVDDPSNEDPRFERVRARNALKELGIDTDTLTQTATRLSRAADALRARAAEVAEQLVDEPECGALCIDRDGFAQVERDTQMRLLARALCWVSATPYRPRASALTALLDRVLAGGGGTLHRCEVVVEAAGILIFPELKTGAELDPSWAAPWIAAGQNLDIYDLRPLGPDGWAQLPKDAREGLNHRVAQTLPALFDGDDLKGFARAGYGAEYWLEFNPIMGTFAAYLVSR